MSLIIAFILNNSAGPDEMPIWGSLLFAKVPFYVYPEWKRVKEDMC